MLGARLPWLPGVVSSGRLRYLPRPMEPALEGGAVPDLTCLGGGLLQALVVRPGGSMPDMGLSRSEAKDLGNPLLREDDPLLVRLKIVDKILSWSTG